MNKKDYREFLIFLAGPTPQIATEILSGLIQDCNPPIFPDEIHITTNSNGEYI